MKPAIIIGIVMIVLGIAGIAYRGIPYTKEEHLDLGPIHASAEHEKTFPIPAIVSFAVLAGGIVLVVVGARKA